MPESAAPSLEQILWRALDRFPEEPALVDALEFADRIAGAFVGELPSEQWVDRFFEGSPELRARARLDMAEAVVRAARKRMQVYEFDLDRLEYVVIEEEKRVVVVSDFGQFVLPNNDQVGRAIESAVVSQERAFRGATRSSDPRAYLVREDGRLVALDPTRMARALAQLDLRQILLPAVERPPGRLEPFQPRRRELTPEREVEALRANDPRTRRSLPQEGVVVTPAAPDAMGLAKADVVTTPADEAPDASAQSSVLVLLPDGSVAKPEIGAASRWQQMVGDWSARAALLTAPAVAELRRTELGGGSAVASATARPVIGAVAERSDAHAAALIAARADRSPVSVLGDEELARAVAGGARLVPALSPVFAAPAERFWVQPELAFSPSDADLAELRAQRSAPHIVASGQPLALGEITGDPWADWALVAADDAPLARRRDLTFRGAQVLAVRAPDGTLLRASDSGLPVRLAARDDSADAASPDARDSSPLRVRLAPESAFAVRLAARDDSAVAVRRPDGTVFVPPPHDAAARKPPVRFADLAPRSGAVPASALATLRLAIERTASAGAYRLPALRIASAPDAVDAGERLDFSPFDSRRGAVHLAAAPVLADRVARLVLSLPFPARSSLHVGADLTDALSAWLAGPLVPAAPSGRRGIEAIPVVAAPAPAFASSPDLLRRAAVAQGDWIERPGAIIEEPRAAAAPAQVRPLGTGEDEIVVPLPLWAEMGRGRISATQTVLASPAATPGYEPPLGRYRLEAPWSVLDFTEGGDDAQVEAVRVARLVGPSTLDLVAGPSGFEARRAFGERLLAKVPVVEDEQELRPRRVRIGAPLEPDAIAVVRARIPGAPADVPPAAELDGVESISGVPGDVSDSAGIPVVRPTLDREGIPAARSAAAVASPELAAAPPPRLPFAGEDDSAGNDASSARPAASAEQQPFRDPQGLPPGTWSGAARSARGFVAWAYADTPYRAAPRRIGAIDVVDVDRGSQTALPAGLRFRYVGAPLWWTRPPRDAAPLRWMGSADDAPQPWMDSAMPGASHRAGAPDDVLSRSLLAVGGDADARAPLDAGWDARAERLARSRLSLAGFAELAAAPQAAAEGPETVYVAIDEQGRAGPVGQAALASATRRNIDALQMSIVAAIPPAPPPLETMTIASAAPPAPAHARRRPEKPGETQDDAVSHSKIEGSVDAIAQRIYHRIRRRIESDRERFGG